MGSGFLTNSLRCQHLSREHSINIGVKPDRPKQTNKQTKTSVQKGARAKDGHYLMLLEMSSRTFGTYDCLSLYNVCHFHQREYQLIQTDITMSTTVKTPERCRAKIEQVNRLPPLPDIGGRLVYTHV